MRNYRALISGLNRLEHLHRAKTQLQQAFWPQAHNGLLQAGLGFHLQVHSAFHLRNGLPNLPGFLVEHVKVVAENVDHKLSSHAGKSLLDALGQERQDFEREARKFGQCLPDFADHRFRLVAAERLEVHVQFAVVRAPGIFALLGPAGLLRDGADVRVLK